MPGLLGTDTQEDVVRSPKAQRLSDGSRAGLSANGSLDGSLSPETDNEDPLTLATPLPAPAPAPATGAPPPSAALSPAASPATDEDIDDDDEREEEEEEEEEEDEQPRGSFTAIKVCRHCPACE